MFVVVGDMADGTALSKNCCYAWQPCVSQNSLTRQPGHLHDNGHSCFRNQTLSQPRAPQETPMQTTDSGHELWKVIPQTAYYVVAIIAAIWALVVYRRNRRLEQAKWLSTFYDKFYETEKYKTVRELLDSSKTDEIAGMVEKEDPAFTDYLNFFEHVAIFAASKQLRIDDVEASFCYYLNCLKAHERVRSYINNTDKGYEKLKEYLYGRDDHGVLVSLRNLARRRGSR